MLDQKLYDQIRSMRINLEDELRGCSFLHLSVEQSCIQGDDRLEKKAEVKNYNKKIAKFLLLLGKKDDEINKQVKNDFEKLIVPAYMCDLPQFRVK